MKYSANKIFTPALFLLTLLFALTHCQVTNNDSSPEDYSISGSTDDAKRETKRESKHRGAHVFRIDNANNFDFLDRTNIDWVTLVPWGFQEDYDSPSMAHHHGDSLNILRRDSSYLHRIDLIRSAGFKVFMKPHVWIDNPREGTWRSDIYPENEENWQLWKESYRDFILRYAKIAEQSKVEMFCIGTEFSKLTLHKTAYWKALIKEVRTIYSGKLTYAANWYNEYEHISFWDALDYIGIQAYFPLAKDTNPSIEEISKGWDKFLPTIKAVHKKYNRKIIFTEMGYKSTTDSAIKPWEWLDNPYDTTRSYSSLTQANCYEAFYKTVWPEKWFAGVHLWQWNTHYIDGYNGRDNRDFTPQNKQAEAIIARYFDPKN